MRLAVMIRLSYSGNINTTQLMWHFVTFCDILWRFVTFRDIAQYTSPVWNILNFPKKIVFKCNHYKCKLKRLKENLTEWKLLLYFLQNSKIKETFSRPFFNLNGNLLPFYCRFFVTQIIGGDKELVVFLWLSGDI